MKSIFYFLNYFILLLIVIFFEEIYSLLDFTYPSAIGLMNQNVFIVEQNGVFVYDEELKNIIYSHTFEESEKITSLDSLSKVVIKYYSNFVICLIKEKIFLFDYEGKFLKKTNIIIEDENYYYPSLNPIFLNDVENYYYVISYFIHENSAYKQKIFLYKINLTNKSNSLIGQITLDKMQSKALAGLSTDEYDFENKGLSCEYMQCENEDSYNFLVCFFIIKKIIIIIIYAYPKIISK